MVFGYNERNVRWIFVWMMELDPNEEPTPGRARKDLEAGIIMTESNDQSIPKISFGLCRWCGSENQRMQYLMCPNCFRVANMIPSKTMVLLNRPEVKKRLAGGATIRNITPELRRFLKDPKTRFPPEQAERKHWDAMQEEAAANVTQRDIKIYLEDMISRGVHELPPTDEELAAVVGLESILRFILHVSVIRGLLKIDYDEEEAKNFNEVCQDCMEEAIVEDPTQGIEPDKTLKETSPIDNRPGMKIRELIMKKYGR